MSKIKAILIISAVAVIGIAAALLLTRNKDQVVFNEIETLVEAAPKWSPDSFSEDLNENELNSKLGINFRECLPRTLAQNTLVAYANYAKKNELHNITFSVLEDSQEFYGKTIVCDVSSRNWSELSASGIDYVYSDASKSKSRISDVEVVLSVRPAYTFENKESGYKEELSAVYLAQFIVNDYAYYVEGRDGIQKNEFLEFVTSIINNYRFSKSD